MVRLITIAFLIVGVTLFFSCFSSKHSTYDAPPGRTISLDSVGTGPGPYRYKPEPDSFYIEFVVPRGPDCPVKVEFFQSARKRERLLVDSVYSTGVYKIGWDRRDGQGEFIKPLRAYYYVISICDTTYTKSFYYRRELAD